MKKIKGLAFFILLIGVICCCFGIGFVLFDKDVEKDSVPSTSETDSQDYQVLEDGTKVYEGYTPEMEQDITVNNSKNLKKEHCLDSLCITSMEVKYQKDVFGNVILKMKNNSDETIPKGFVNLEFETSQGTSLLYFYHLEIEPNKTVQTTVGFLDTNIVSATDYQMTYPTDEQLQEYQKTVVS